MSLSFRRFRAIVALVAFSSMFGLGLATVGHFGPNDDTACGEVSLAGHAMVQFEAVAPQSPLSHCPFCHWQRAVSGASIAAAGDLLSQLQPLSLLTPAADRAVGRVALDERLSRGPPSPFRA